MRNDPERYARPIRWALVLAATLAFPSASAAQASSGLASVQLVVHVPPGVRGAGANAAPAVIGMGLPSLSVNRPFRVMIRQVGTQSGHAVLESEQPGVVPWDLVLRRIEERGLLPVASPETPVTIDLLLEPVL